MNHPCEKCITRSTCRQHKVTKNDADILNFLGYSCPEFYNYMTLKDLGLKTPPDDMPMKDRSYWNSPFSKRVLETMKLFKWSEYYNMERYEILAKYKEKGEYYWEQHRKAKMNTKE